jgi:hypothetical protein
MFESNAFNLQQSLNDYSQAERTAQNERKALHAFRNALTQGWWERVWASVSNRSLRLLDLNEVESQGRVRDRHYAGIKTVRIDQIKGSEGRTEDFNANFKPLQARSKDRWTSIARAQLNDQPLPPVELIQVGEIYFVRDGHHRISVARALGQESIEAEVTSFQIDSLPSNKEKCPTCQMALGSL